MTPLIGVTDTSIYLLLLSGCQEKTCLKILTSIINGMYHYS